MDTTGTIHLIGIFVAEIEEKEAPNIKAKHFSREVEIPDDMLKDMTRRCAESSEKSCIMLGEDFKVVGFTLDVPNTYAGFVLDKKEDSAQVFVNVDNKKAQISSAIQNGSESATIEELLSFEVEVGQKLSDPKILKDKIIAQTNQLLDSGNFEKAKGLISLAEEVPAKLTETVGQAEEARQGGNYKMAEKLYRTAADHAATIEEDHLHEVLLAKADRVKQIPNFLKRQKTTVQKLQKPQADQDYDTLNSLIAEVILLSDKLEDDEIIPDLRVLSEYASEASSIKKQLAERDQKMRVILDKVIAKRGS
jgi:hypothetical protein